MISTPFDLNRRRTVAIKLMCAIFMLAPPAPLGATGGREQATVPAVIERGKFRLYELKQVQGEESYEIARDGDSLVVNTTLEMPYRDGKSPLTATLRVRPDLTPESFDIKGNKPSNVAIDAGVKIEGHTATVREGSRTRQVAAPHRFFTIAGYAPIAIEMMLARYWVRHGIKGSLKTLPDGQVSIEHRGRDRVTIDGNQVELERYSLDGQIWGRETLWLDSDNRLVALTGFGNDAEFISLQAIREGYESALPFFIKRTAEDAIERLTGLAGRLSPRRKGALALVGGALIDGTGKATVADSVVIIDGDRVAAAGPRSEVKVPKGAARIDVRGKSVLPGLWDMHAHMLQAELGPLYLAAGVTTVRDVGNEFEYALALRDATRQGRGLGPRMLLAGYINGKNSHHAFDIQVETPEEVRAAVKHYKDAGFEQIKIREHVKLDTLKAITAEAHRVGMTVTGHVPNAMNALRAVEAGMDQINHIHFLLSVMAAGSSRGQRGIDFESAQARRAIEIFKERGTVIDPTIAIYEIELRSTDAPIESFEPGFRKAPPEFMALFNGRGSEPQKAQAAGVFFGQLLAMIGALHRAGVPIVAGTDVGVPGHSIHRELELYVKAGLTPIEAIQAATLVPARVMGLDKELGTIAVGKRADLIIVDGRPDLSISDIRKVKSVVAGGRMYDCARLWQSMGFRP